MKKSITLIAAILLFAVTTSNATHIVGGEFSVAWVSGNTFHLTLHFYRDCKNGQVDFDDPISIGVYDKVTNVNQQCLSVPLTSRQTLTLGDGCYTPNLCVELGVYEYDFVIPNNPNGYYISSSNCCRNSIIVNITNPLSAGETWYIEIPDPALHNSTPVFGAYPKAYMCANNLNVQDFSATDADNDSLVYSLITPYDAPFSYTCPSPGPYPSVTWQTPYSATNMIGGTPPMSINSQTGILTANPSTLGVYVFTVRVEQFRRSDKLKLGETRRDVQYAVLTCTVAAAYPDTTICGGNPVTLHASGGTSYSWAPTTGLSNPNIANPVATVFSTTTYTVSVSSGGCVTTATATINVNSAMKVAITPGGATTFCQGDSVILTASGAANYSWSTGATTSSIAANATNTYTVTGTTSGCSGSASINVVVNPSPVIAITPGGPTTVCKGGTVKLTASGGTTYSWSPGGATTAAINANATNTYTVTGTTSGCSATATQAILINPAPKVTIAAAGPVTICQGDSVTLSASGAQSYLWSTGSTNASIQSKVNQTYYAVGTDANGCTAVSNFITVVVNRNPVATITPNGPTSFCEGGSVGFCVSAATTYLWSPGGETTQCITTGNPGNYQATVTNASGCSSIGKISTIVNPPPTVVAVPDGPVAFCQPLTVTLTVSGADSYTWSPGGETTPSITVSQSGTYYATGTDGNGCSSVSNVIVVSANPPPTVAITPNSQTTFCAGDSVALTASGADSYLWNPTGDTTVSVTVKSSGTYFVVGTDENGCSGTSNAIVVTVNPNPTVSIIAHGNTAICEGGSVQLCATNGATFSWNLSADTSQCITALDPGKYIVTITDTNGCTGVSDPLIVSVALPPTVLVTPVNGNCTTGGMGSACTIPVGSGYTYSWNTGATSACINNLPAGSYTVTVTDSNNCSASSSGTVSISSTPPNVNAGADTSIGCGSASLQLNGSSATAGATFSWTTGDGHIASGATTLNPIVDAAGTYTLTVTDPSNGCTASDNVVVTRGSVPPANCGSGCELTCARPTMLIGVNNCDNAANTAYAWSGPNGFTSSQQCLTIGVAGTYTVTVISTPGGCTSTCTVLITSNITAPTVSAGADTTISCGSGTIQLHGSSSASSATYSWTASGGGHIVSGGNTLNPVIDSAGIYTLTVTDITNGCTGSDAVVVTLGQGTSCNISVTSCRSNHQHCRCTLNHQHCNGENCTLNHQHCQCSLNHVHCFFSESSCEESHTHCTCSLNHQHCTSQNCTLNHQHCQCNHNHQHCYSYSKDNVCSGGSVTLVASGGTSYRWSTGATTASITVTTSGTYSVTVYNGSCSSNCSHTVTINTPPSCDISGNLVIAKGQCTTLCAPDGYSLYLWSNGSTARCITVSSAGTYSVTVTNSEGCSSTCSVCVTIQSSCGRLTDPNTGASVAANSFGNMDVSVFPNPFEGVATIEFMKTDEASRIRVEVYSVDGSKVATLFDADVEAGVTYKAEFDGSNLPSGVYIYRITGGDQVTDGKLLLMK